MKNIILKMKYREYEKDGKVYRLQPKRDEILRELQKNGLDVAPWWLTKYNTSKVANLELIAKNIGYAYREFTKERI